MVTEFALLAKLLPPKLIIYKKTLCKLQSALPPVISPLGQYGLFLTPSEYPCVQLSQKHSRTGSSYHRPHPFSWPRPATFTILATPLGPGAVGGLADALRASTYTLQRLSPRPGESTSGSLEQVPQAPPLSPVSCPRFRLSQVFSACFLPSLSPLPSLFWRLGPGPYPVSSDSLRISNLSGLGATLRCVFAVPFGVRPAARREFVQT